MAGGEGVEPSPTGPEPVVLPLDYPPTCKVHIILYCLRMKVVKQKNNAPRIKPIILLVLIPKIPIIRL